MIDVVLLLVAGAAVAALCQRTWVYAFPDKSALGDEGIHPSPEMVSLLGPAKPVRPNPEGTPDSETAAVPTGDIAFSQAEGAILPGEEPDWDALVSTFAQLADYCDTLPADLERLVEEEILLDAGEEETDAAEAGDGEDLEAYVDRLDELADRVARLVGDRMQDEVVAGLADWLRRAGLSASAGAEALLGAAGWSGDVFARQEELLALYDEALPE